MLVKRGQYLIAKSGCYPDIRAGCDFVNQKFGLVKRKQARPVRPYKDAQCAAQPKLQSTGFRPRDFIV